MPDTALVSSRPPLVFPRRLAGARQGAAPLIGPGKGISTTPPPTDYANPGGSGDRTGMILVTANAVPSSGTLANLVDGVDANLAGDACFFTVADENGLIIQLDFGRNRYISEFTFRKQNLNLNGNWFYDASKDGTTFLEISADFTPGTSLAVVTPVAPPDAAGCRYYRLRHRSVAPAANPWLTELEAKIDAG